MRIRTGVTVVFALGLIAVTLGAVLPVSGATNECQAIEDRQVCVEDLSAPGTLLVGEGPDNMSVTLENVGSAAAEPMVVVNTLDPNNESSSFQLARPSLEAGESTTISQPLNASTPGTHGLQVVVADPATGQRYDISEAVTIEVRTEPAPGLGGPIDRTEIALAALVLSLLGMAGLAWKLRD